MKKSIRNKLISLSMSVAGIAIIVLGVVSWRGFTQMKDSSNAMSSNLVEVSAANNEQILRQQTLNELSNLARATANTVDARISTLTDQVTLLAHSMEELYATPNAFARIPVLPADPENAGVYVSQLVLAEHTDPEAIVDEVGLLGNMGVMMNQVGATFNGASSAYIGTQSGFTLLFDDRSDLKSLLPHFDPTVREWYTSAVQAQTATWSEVFEDSYGRGLSFTCGHPVYDPNGTLMAVVAIGSQLSELSSTISDVSIGETGHVLVIDSNGSIIMGQSLANAENGIVTHSESLFNAADPELVIATAKMINGESGVLETIIDGEDVYLAYAPMQSIPWSVVTFISTDEAMLPVVQSNELTSALALSAHAEVDNITSATLIAMIAGMGASSVLALMVGIYYSNRIATPIRRLEKGVREISRGHLDCTLDIQTGDEIENLATAFNNMTSDLKHYIADLTSVTAERERIGAELGVATQIQESMLPNTFPAFPDYHEFDVHATMVPAKEVGGDFYDFYLVSERKLAIVMADVSGKGVPAALFMVITKILIQNFAQKGEQPADILRHTNHQLCKNNRASMFVTAWIALLDLDTGELTYANAGHTPPIISQQGQPFQYLPTDSGFILAGLENIEYQQSSLTLQSGDLLYLYTDGVTEASNLSDELYGEDRLLEKMNTYNTQSLPHLLEHIKIDIDAFVGDAPQHDDITMLALRFGQK